jgi:cobalt/nickel transport system permease protein
VPVDTAAAVAEQKRRRRLRPGVVAAVVVGVLVVLTPLGLLAPGGAFGEDGPQDLDLGQLGLTAIPTGLARYASFWQDALFPDYLSDSPWTYIVSAVIGIAVVGVVVHLVVSLLVKLFARRAADVTTDTTA